MCFKVLRRRMEVIGCTKIDERRVELTVRSQENRVSPKIFLVKIILLTGNQIKSHRFTIPNTDRSLECPRGSLAFSLQEKFRASIKKTMHGLKLFCTIIVVGVCKRSSRGA